MSDHIPGRGLQIADQATTGIVIVVTVAYLVGAAQLPDGAGVVPSIVGWAVLLVALVQFLAPWVRVFRPFLGEPVAEEETVVFTDPRLRRRLIVVLASLVTIPVLALLLGLPLTLPLYVAAFTLIDRQRIPVVVVSTAIMGAVSYGLLVILLEMRWNDGLLWNL